MPSIKQRLTKSIIALRSSRGRDTMMFLLFVGISAILWSVLSLNEEEQYDVRLPLKITHVPDSVTLISEGPDALSVSLRGKGTQMLKMSMGQVPTVNIDFRAYRSHDQLHLTSTDIKGLVRTATGGAQVSVVYPDSLSLPYTTHGGFRVPVTADFKVTAGPQSSLAGRPRLSADTVGVFITGAALPDNFEAVTTEPIRLIGLDETTTRRVRLIGPAGSRIIPDSIDITFEVEPLIFKSRKVVIEPVNVPENIKLITFPAQIDVFYMVPMSQYRISDNRFRVVADYRTIRTGSKNVKLQIKNVPDKFRNVHLSADSAEYIIERH
ncbi:MAG: hypothetical protein K2F91_09615 [Muribaculaceae bacterium]|nr:hypothetical protein [Muribaculaceae bacterium]